MAIINLFVASGHAKVVMDIIAAQEDEVGCLYDDNPENSTAYGNPVRIIINRHNMKNISDVMEMSNPSPIAWLHKNSHYAA